MRSDSLLLFLVSLHFVGSSIQADVFDRHTSDYLRKVADDSDGLTEISLTDLHKLQPLSKTETTPVAVFKTSEGNWTKAAVTWAFRRTDDGLLPILTIERFVTYRNDFSDVAKAAGDNIMLFEGFAYDFDIGQVVPAEQGGDIKFTGNKSIETLNGTKLWGLDGSQLPDEKDGEAPDPTDHAGVLPTDFGGIWKVSIDGRWSGTMRLKIDKGRMLAGTFISDDTKSTYEVFGRVASPPQHARLTIQLENAQQDVECYLWTTDKSAMAGTSSLAGQTFGFYATREKE
jgi:hypothetical protein